jgi:hypothetical protein
MVQLVRPGERGRIFVMALYCNNCRADKECAPKTLLEIRLRATETEEKFDVVRPVFTHFLPRYLKCTGKEVRRRRMKLGYQVRRRMKLGCKVRRRMELGYEVRRRVELTQGFVQLGTLNFLVLYQKDNLKS